MTLVKTFNSLFSYLLFFLFILPISNQAQMASLVVDYQTGTGDGFNQFNYQGMSINGKMVLPANDGVLGEELAIIDDGSLQLLKDINEGQNGSNPSAYYKQRAC